MIDKLTKLFQRILHFLQIGIWKVDTKQSGKPRAFIYTAIKSFILAYRNMDWSQMNTKAAALTYNTLLSIVPLLAVLFAIARGFGFQNIVQSELFGYFEGQREVLEKAMVFIDKSLEYAQSGIFLGIGLILLLYTVLNLIGGIESNFNAIWRIKNDRSYYRQFTDYTALILIAPVFLVCNGGLSILLNSSAETKLVGLVIGPFVELLPYLITILLFTFIYLYLPNTKVKFSSALFAGFIAGLAFQLFQQLYIGGQIWISKYNAIYGSFAALPLLLLWLQLSWLIVLIGVEISFGYQNVKKFSYEKDTKNISRRYKDFVILLIITLIVKRFEKGEKPYTASEISERFKIPTRVTSDSLYLLLELNIIRETPSDDNIVPAYIPALDINKISVAYLFNKIDTFGMEDFFNIDINGEFFEEWNVIQDIRRTLFEKEKDTLIKDL
ncbi:YihY/virulence factor BrkB family protein [Dysgonomonas macrotermitis]|uniref:Membrane protein n=1 Tax=Dysgonomonas macrotermitis TaxID=1346286 RepID=A0A1M5I570_9BACT|nr:YihY/virulence factor BrkB family protein [Dysgonomonas macrotermitis]SHG23317.1 membrane protein [Dysgonomonas macrotermitis]